MAKFERIDLGLKEAYDELFMNDKSRAENKLPKIYNIPTEQIDSFDGHPFKVRDDDEDMIQLVESVKQRGIITPITVREKKDGRYEIISGHRRKRACELAGLDTVKAEIKDLTRDEAIILMVESNLQRSTILPSEKAFAYKMRLDAMKRQAGRPTKENYVPLGHNFNGKPAREILAEASPDSNTQIQRYVRLIHLIPELLELVDNRKIALRPAVELSYLTKEEQKNLCENIVIADATPSLAQAIKMHGFSKEGKLTNEVIESIMLERKPNQMEKISFKADNLRRFIPKNYTDKQTEEYVVKALEYYGRYLERQRDRER